MNSPLISIIVPVYKVEQYLDICVASIVKQTYKNLEIILVDDGSPDKCPSMCDEWAERDNRIRVIHKKNGGASTARNAGLDAAKGDYIGFVDSDDYIEENMYEILLNALKDTKIKMSSCLNYNTKDDGEIYNPGGSHSVIERNVRETLDEVFGYKTGISVWRRLYERTIFDNIRFPENETNEDYPVFIPTTILAGGTVFVDLPLYYYRLRQGSVTKKINYSSNTLEVVYKNLNRMWEQIQDYNLSDMKSFHFFCIRSLYSQVLPLGKYYPELDERTKQWYQKVRKIMLKHPSVFLSNKNCQVKDKFFFILILLNIVRPVCKLIGKL